MTRIEGGRKEWWGFKSARVLVLSLRRYLEKSPKGGYDAEKGIDSGCLSAASCFLTFVKLFNFFFPLNFNTTPRNEKCVQTYVAD